MNKEKLVILLTVAIDVIGLGIIIPIMPVYVESFGVNALVVTSLFAVFSLFSFLSTPFLGILSDKIGRRPVLMASILSTSIGWFIFAASQSVLFLFIGRIIDGVAAGNISTAQSAISDISKDKAERTANLGLTGAIFGIGFLIGPLIGGLLSKVSTTFPFWFVGGLALFNFILAYFFLPETNRNLTPEKKIHWNPLKPIIKVFAEAKLRTLYVVWFAFNFVAWTSNTILALYLLKAFGYGPLGIGIFFTLIGVIIAVNQGLLLKRFWLKHFSEQQLIKIMFAVFCVGYAVMVFPQLGLFIVGLVLTAFGQSILRVAITSEVVSETDPSERGEANGVLASVMALASIFAPLIAGVLFEIQPYIPFIVGSFLSAVSLLIIYNRKVEKPVEVSGLA